MELKPAFASTLRKVRLLKGLSQEDFYLVSSRTNMSVLERAKSVPTIGKLEQICTILGVHPLTLMAMCYAEKDGVNPEDLLKDVVSELSLLKSLGQLDPEKKE